MNSQPTIALSFGTATVRAAASLRGRIEEAGFAVEPFSDGRELEAAIATYRFVGVCDLALSELANDSADRDRLTAAGLAGVPQLLIPGGLDQLAPRALDRVSKEVALKASAAHGPTAILIPENRWSDAGVLEAELLRVLVAGLRLWLAPQVKLEVVAAAVGEPAFADAAAQTLIALIPAADKFPKGSKPAAGP